MTYLDDLADRIRGCLPAGTSVPEGAGRLFILYAVVLRAKGTDVTASDVHDAWAAWMQEQDPHHDALRPYDDLAPSVQAEDGPFLEAIRAAAQRP
ncbi:hypothetical protein ACI784_14660 [Geodermatophilus sp. SYSU D01186]